MNYYITDRELTTGDFDSIEMGGSIFEISDILGEPDTWIGSGMLRPVYLLKDNKVVVLHFEYPAACDGLREIALIDEKVFQSRFMGWCIVDRDYRHCIEIYKLNECECNEFDCELVNALVDFLGEKTNA